MRAVLIIFSAALEREVMKTLNGAGAKNYTKFPYLLGEGGHSEPHLDSHVWPGSNIGLLVLCDEPTKEKVLSHVRAIKKEHLNEGIKAFVLPVEEVI